MCFVHYAFFLNEYMTIIKHNNVHGFFYEKFLIACLRHLLLAGMKSMR